jgi:hypothetical protein
VKELSVLLIFKVTSVVGLELDRRDAGSNPAKAMDF